MPTLQLGPQRIAYRETSGTGPAVLLVHGNSSSSRIWQHTLDGAPGRQYRIVAIDLPGHGESADAAEADRAATYSIPGYARIVRGVVEQLALKHAVFVGWSLGGHAVLEAAPALTDAAGFMIFGTPPLPFPPAADMGGAFLKLGPGFVAEWSESDANDYVADFMATGTPAPGFMLEDARRTDGHARGELGASIGTVGYADELQIASTLGRPLAVLHGAQEQIVALPYLARLAPALPTLWQGRVQVVADAGHALQWEQTAAFAQALDAFVRHCQAH